MKKENKTNNVSNVPTTPFDLSQFSKPVSINQSESEQFKVLNNLMDTKTDLEAKTDINKPFSFAVLNAWKTYLIDLGLKEIAGDIDNFVSYYLKICISKKRNGRKEIIEAVKSLNTMFNNPIMQNSTPINPLINK